MIKLRHALALPVLALAALSAPIVAQAAPDPSACIWGQLPQDGRTQTLASESLQDVNGGLENLLNGWNEANFDRTMTLCKVGETQIQPAASLLAAYAIRLWVDNKLGETWSQAELDRAYRALTPAEKALLKAGTADDGTEPDGYHEAVEHFFKPLLSADNVPQPAIKLLFVYLIARLTQDAALAEFNSK
ncbi:MAG: hypothetical protein GC145_05395 [Caulobacter sp.]|nr:hypothetical protein [Caulobacter sp.]